MAWTEELIQELTQLWDAGHSASHIGKKLGVSKNAVIGKAHRLKLPARPSPIRAESSALRVRRPAPKTAPRPVSKPAFKPAFKPQPVLEVVAKPAPRPARRRADGPGCLWPIGDPGRPEFHFCGEPATPGKPYCEAHCAKAYIVKSRARSEAA
jgi:GcrA cell cycle regulator